VEFSDDALIHMAPVVRALGAAEGLPAHVRSVDARLAAMERAGDAAAVSARR